MSRAVPLVLVGVWLGLLLSSWLMAGASFRTVDRVLGPDETPELRARLEPVPEAERRAALRHVASEANRWMFRRWAVLQLALSIILAALLWGRGGAARGLALAALGVLLVQAVGLGPAIERLGRALDFLPRPLPVATGRRFGLLHGGYVLLDLVKAVLLAAAARAAAV